MHRIQDPSQSSVGNLNTARHESGRRFRDKNKEYLKAKIEVLENEKNEMGWACSTYGGEARRI
jgi:hypothetical protein